MEKKEIRLNKIIDLLRARESLPVKDIAAALNVSEMTVRRDLDLLKDSNVVERTHGRATYNAGDISENADHSYDLSIERFRKSEEKERIGSYAAKLIKRDDILIVDSGSSTGALAKYVPEGMDLTVLCYNLNMVNALRNKRGIRLIMAGGYFHPRNQMFESPEGINLIRDLRANKLFLSASGVHEQLGMTTALAYEVPVKRAILQSSHTRILLADSSKFGMVRSAYFAEIEELDMVITDSGLPDGWKEIFQEKGVELKIV
jgi:DeoR family deoxyribose operon repressor